MKFLSYSAFFLMFIAITSQTFAQETNSLIKENLTVATGIIDENVLPESLDILAALNEGDDIFIDFETKEAGMFNLNIYDVTGKLILSENFTTNNTKNKLRVKSPITSRGIYIISLYSNKDKCVKKFYL